MDNTFKELLEDKIDIIRNELETCTKNGVVFDRERFNLLMKELDKYYLILNAVQHLNHR